MLRLQPEQYFESKEIESMVDQINFLMHNYTVKFTMNYATPIGVGISGGGGGLKGPKPPSTI